MCMFMCLRRSEVSPGGKDTEDTIIPMTNAASVDAFPESKQVRFHQQSVMDRRTQRTYSSLMNY